MMERVPDCVDSFMYFLSIGLMLIFGTFQLERAGSGTERVQRTYQLPEVSIIISDSNTSIDCYLCCE